MIKRDIVNFSMVCGMFRDGASTTYSDQSGNHTVTGTGDTPRVYTLDNQEISFEDLKEKVGSANLSPFSRVGD